MCVSQPLHAKKKKEKQKHRRLTWIPLQKDSKNSKAVSRSCGRVVKTPQLSKYLQNEAKCFKFSQMLSGAVLLSLQILTK